MTKPTIPSDMRGMPQEQVFEALFSGILSPQASIENETFMLSSFHPPEHYRHCFEDVLISNENVSVSRWDRSRFPLKVAMIPAYGYLFSVAEFRRFLEIVHHSVSVVHDADPTTFFFHVVSDETVADIVFRCRREEGPLLQRRCIRYTNPNQAISRAEVSIVVPQAHPEKWLQVEKDILEGLIAALGVSGHYETPVLLRPFQQVATSLHLTSQEIKTLQLLYRCPIGMTRQHFLGLWQQYVDRAQKLSLTCHLDDSISQSIPYNKKKLPHGDKNESITSR